MGRAAASAHALWLRQRCALCLRCLAWPGSSRSLPACLRVVLFCAAAAAAAAAASAAAAVATATAAACCLLPAFGPISRRRRHSRVTLLFILSLSQTRVRRVCFKCFIYFFCASIYLSGKKKEKRNFRTTILHESMAGRRRISFCL